MIRVLIGAIASIMVLMAIAFFGPSLIDWNSQKTYVVSAVRALTGRDVTIGGDVELTVLPSPALTARSVALDNRPAAAEPVSADLEELRLSVAFWPLFRGEIRVEQVVFVRPTIHLESAPGDHAGGPGGWAQVLQAVGAEQLGTDWLAGRLRFESYAIEDGTLVYRDGAAADEQRIERVHATVVANPTAGQLTIDGRADLLGRPAMFEAILDRFDGAGSTRVRALLELPDAAVSGAFDGTLTQRLEAVDLRGHVTGGGADLAALVAVFSGDQGPDAWPTPEMMRGVDFSFGAELIGERDEVRLTALELSLGEVRLNGEATARPGLPLGLEARLEADTIDLDRILSAAGSDLTSVPRLVLPAALAADLDLTIETLRYRGDAVRQARLQGGLGDGTATIYEASALLPGETTVSLSGQLADDGSGPRFAGYIRTAADSLPATLDWLGVERTGAVADHLRSVELSGEVAATPKQLELHHIELTAGGHQARGGIVVALKERPALGVGLLIDRLDLAPYLDLAGGQEGESSWSHLSGLLHGFDANMDVRVETLVHPDITVDDFHLAGTLHDDVLSLEDLSGRDAAGNALRFSGAVSRLNEAPALAGTLDLRVADPGPLAGLADFDPEPLEALAPFKLRGEVRAEPGALGFEVALAALGGQADLSGTAALSDAPMTFDLAVEASHKDLSKLANRLADRQVFGPGLGRLTAKARVTGSMRRIEVSGLSGTLGPARAKGGFAIDLTAERPVLHDLDLDLAARHANVARLLTALAWPSPVKPALGGLDLAGRLTGSGSALRLSGFTGRIGPAALSGEITARPTGFDAGPAGFELTDLDLAVKLRHPSLAGLLAALSIEPPVAPSFGAVKVSGRVSGRPSALALSELRGRVGPVEMAGTATVDLSGPVPAATDMTLDLLLAHPDLAVLAAAMGRPGTVPESFGGIDLRGELTGTRERLQVSGLQGTIGPGRLQGVLAADLTGARPKVDLDLTTGPLPLALLLASSGGFVSGSDGDAANPGGGWSNAPLDLSRLRTFDADLRLRSTAWLYGDTRLADAGVRATLRNGAFNLRELSGKLFGGDLKLAGKVEAGRQIDVGLMVEASGLELSRVLRLHTDFDRLSGPVTVKASLLSRGSSAAELVAGLEGRGTLVGTLDVAAKAKEAASAALLALLGGDDAPGGAIDPTHTLLNAFSGEPAELTGSFAISRGVVRTDDARIDGRGGYAMTRGQADLAAWRLKTRVDLYRLDNLEDSYLTVDLTGPLGDLDSRFRSQRADALIGAGSGSMAERLMQFRGMLGEVVDFKPMARYVLGRHTETITPAQWSRFLEQYEKLFVSGYELPSGGAWTGDWRIQEIRPYGEDQLITIAFPTKAGGTSKVGFRVRESSDALFGFKIIDAIADGVSFLVTQKSEFSAILKKRGVDGLIRVLESEFSDGPTTPNLPDARDWEALRVVPHQTKN